MSTYCGNCGVPLASDALANGKCPSCGTTISSTGDVIASDAPDDISQVPTRTTPPQPTPDAQPTPPKVRPWLVRVRADPRTIVMVSPRLTGAGATAALIVLAVVATLVLAGLAVLVGFSWSQLHAGGLPGTSGSPSSATAGPATVQTTHAPDATATAASATQPKLTVEPRQIHITTCVAASAQFSVTNSGGGTLEWSASASNALYQIAPASGALSRDQQQAVTVSNITLSGQITVAAPGAANAPLTVTITCG